MELRHLRYFVAVAEMEKRIARGVEASRIAADLEHADGCGFFTR